MEEQYRNEIMKLEDRVTYELKKQYDNHLFDMIRLEQNHREMVKLVEERENYERAQSESKIKIEQLENRVLQLKHDFQLKLIQNKEQYDK